MAGSIPSVLAGMTDFIANLVVEQGFFFELSAVIITAVVIGIIFKKLRQPTILAYIVTGILLGSAFFGIISSGEAMHVFADLGIAFLLFLVGIHLDPKVLRDIGKTSIITGFGQIAFTFTIGYFVSTALGFSMIEAVYLALGLTLSSTVIIIKLLTDKNELNSLYAKISIGFLLVQDFVAIMAIIAISTFTPGVTVSQQVVNFVLNLSIFVLVVWIVSKYVIKRLFDSIAKSQELLFMGGIGWCFALASLSMVLGFSKEIGAFIAGVSIASLPYSYEVFAKMKYLRDFFIVLFFVYLGSSLIFISPQEVILPAIALSLVVIIGNPLIIFVLMSLLGYKSRTSFMAGSGFAQISEFSLIVILLGKQAGHFGPNELVTPTITLVAVMTISISTYFILYNNRIYERIFKRIPILKKAFYQEDKLSSAKEKQYPLILLGFGETGKKVFSRIKLSKKDVLIIDYDPHEIKQGIKKGFDCIYGDAADVETIKFLLRKQPQIIVSTVMDTEVNERLVNEFKKRKKKDMQLIILASTLGEAKMLYEKKADFVLVPSQIAAEKIGVIINDLQKDNRFELEWIKRLHLEGTEEPKI